MVYRSLAVAGGLAVAASLGACSSSSGPSDVDTGVVLSLATRAAGTGAGALLNDGPVTIVDGENTLVITKVEMVVKEVELKRAEFEGQCEGTSSDDECEELEFGPFLLDLPLSGGATTQFSVAVLPGSYDEFEFKVHKPSSDSENAAFLTAHPDFNGVSIRVTGTWNDVAFTYVTDVSAEQEMDLVPPLVVVAESTTDFTLFIDINSWFRDEGNALIDPATANKGGANESIVNSRITQSFDVFEDSDHDGRDDDDS